MGAIKLKELSAINDSRASFYNKANVVEKNNVLNLYSYETLVATYNKTNKKLTILPNSQFAPNGKYSMTTTRHIKEFAKQNGVNLQKALVGIY